MINVVAGVLVRNGRILCVQKGQTKYPFTSFKFEFPGGKIEPSESPEEALKREMKEELGLEIEVIEHLGIFTHHYPNLSVAMNTFICKDDRNEPILNEHISLNWLPSDKLELLDWAAADLPVVKLLKKLKF